MPFASDRSTTHVIGVPKSRVLALMLWNHTGYAAIENILNNRQTRIKIARTLFLAILDLHSSMVLTFSMAYPVGILFIKISSYIVIIS